MVALPIQIQFNLLNHRYQMQNWYITSFSCPHAYLYIYLCIAVLYIHISINTQRSIGRGIILKIASNVAAIVLFLYGPYTILVSHKEYWAVVWGMKQQSSGVTSVQCTYGSIPYCCLRARWKLLGIWSQGACQDTSYTGLNFGQLSRKCYFERRIIDD